MSKLAVADGEQARGGVDINSKVKRGSPITPLGHRTDTILSEQDCVQEGALGALICNLVRAG